EADKAYQLAKEAEVKALQAQISPHFLFNTMSVITSLIRVDPSKARMLLVSLSHFLRQNLTATTVTITSLEQELRHVKAYLAIEEARFVEKLKVTYDIDDEALLVKTPPLTLQPIVENAVKHGIKEMEQDCNIKITIHKVSNNTLVKVEDNGQGMSKDRIKQLGKQMIDSEKGSGIALYNVNRRLTMMFGESAALQIESEPGQGTRISFSIPQLEEF
ncbi:MAG TPA: sensor histidine kinase, partial [Bacillus bacterium]|nr:sensor histidine kinase [Bacillus sp. (in: firmicutes)]